MRKISKLIIESAICGSSGFPLIIDEPHALHTPPDLDKEAGDFMKAMSARDESMRRGVFDEVVRHQNRSPKKYGERPVREKTLEDMTAIAKARVKRQMKEAKREAQRNPKKGSNE